MSAISFLQHADNVSISKKRETPRKKDFEHIQPVPQFTNTNLEYLKKFQIFSILQKCISTGCCQKNFAHNTRVGMAFLRKWSCRLTVYVDVWQRSCSINAICARNISGKCTFKRSVLIMSKEKSMCLV